jgi:hypothetical protein
MSIQNIYGKELNFYISSYKLDDLISKLSVDETLNGRVVESLEDNKFIINFKGINVITSSLVGLEKGAVISVRVKELSPQIIMQFMPQSSGGIGAEISTVSGFRNLLDSFAAFFFADEFRDLKDNLLKVAAENPRILSLLGSIEEALVNPDRANLSLQLENFIKSSALNPSSLQVNDICFLLFCLREELLDPKFNSISRRKLQNLIKTIDGLTENVIKQKILNRFFSNNALQEFFLQIPLLADGRFLNARIKISDKGGRKGKIDKNNLSIIFSLQTQNLGTIEIKLCILNKQMSIQFMAKNENVRDFISSRQEELKEVFKGLDYQLNYVECMVKEKQDKSGKGLWEEGFTRKAINIVA